MSHMLDNDVYDADTEDNTIFPSKRHTNRRRRSTYLHTKSVTPPINAFKEPKLLFFPLDKQCDDLQTQSDGQQTDLHVGDLQADKQLVDLHADHQLGDLQASLDLRGILTVAFLFFLSVFN